MALSYKSNTYQEMRNDLDGIKRQKGSITLEDIKAVAKSKEVDLDDFKLATQDLNKDTKMATEIADTKGLDRQAIVDYVTTDVRQSPFEYQTRTLRRGLGTTAEAIGFIGEAVLPDDVLNKIEQTYEQNIPRELRNNIQLFFDPVTTPLEEVSGQLSAYALPTTAFVKGGKAAVQATPYIASKYLQLGDKAKKLTTAGSYGVAYAAGATAIEDPRENIYDVISSSIFGNEEATKRLEELAKNPKDVEAQDYLEAFIRNLSIEGLGGAGIHSAGTIAKTLAESLRVGRLAPVRNKVTQIRGKARPYIAKVGDITRPIGRKYNQLFSSRMGTDDNFLAALLKKETSEEAAVIRADGYLTELEGLLKKELDRVNVSERDATKEQYLYFANEFLSGNDLVVGNIQRLLPDAYPLLQKMRDDIDGLSRKLPVGAGKLKVSIDKNMGAYLNRSYRIFDDPSYKKDLANRLSKRPENIRKLREARAKVTRGELSNQEYAMLKQNLSDDIVDKAAQSIANQRGISIDNPEVQQILESIARTENKEAFADFIESLSMKSRYTSSSVPLKQRKDFDLTMRDFLGEIKDPKENFKNTYVKLATMNAQYNFLEEVAGNLSTKFQSRIRQMRELNPNMTQDEAIAELQKKGMQNVSKEIANADKMQWIFKGASENEIANPIQGIYADKAYVDAINKGLDVTLKDIQPLWLRTALQGYSGLKGSSQFSKTVLNIPTHGKNMLGNVIMLSANGILPSGMSVKQAIKTTGNQLRNKNNIELGEQLAEYVELGITNSGIGLGIVRRNLNEAFKDPDKYLNKITGARQIKDVGSKIADIYQAEDDFFKIIHFERTKDYLKKIYPTMSDADIKQMAAARTRDMMPNYRLVPKAFKATGYLPIGDFVAFPAEMIRTTKNLVKYTMQDSKQLLNPSSENFNREAMLATVGIRLAGMTVAGTFGDYVEKLSTSLYGISEEEDKAMSYLDAPYYLNQNKVYLGPVQRDEKTDHIISPKFYLGSFDPYSIIKVGAKAAHQMLIDGEDMSGTEFNKLWQGTLAQTVYPIIGPSMLTETIGDIYTGKSDFNNPSKNFLANSLDKVVDLYDPGYIRFFNRLSDYQNKGLTDNLYTVSEGDVDVPAFLGFRRTNQDLSAGIGRNISSQISAINKADRTFKNVLNNPNATDEDVLEEYMTAQKERLKAFKELKGVLELYKMAGYSIDGIIEDASLGGKKRGFQPSELEIIYSADQNRFMASKPKPRETFEGPLAPFSDQLYNIYDKLNNSRIEK